MSDRLVILTVGTGFLLAWMAGCAPTTKMLDKQPLQAKEQTQDREQPMMYQVNRLAEPIAIDSNWDKPAWREVEPIELTYHMGKKPEHFPNVQAKLMYDAHAIYVIFRVEDQYVRAVAEKHQGPVCRDSCVEFFFTPGTDVKKGYFNLEMNCGGTMLFKFQVIPRQSTDIEPADVERVEVAHSLPRIVEPEITAPTVWTAEYRLPTDMLAKYMPEATRPAPGVTWRANFFKCADRTSHPHWLTWSFVDRPKPDFHVPEYFGTIKFR